MRTYRVAGMSIAVGAAFFASPRTAKADFADDVTAVVEQVVEDEVASTVIPNAARCFPIACDVLPASIYALQAKRYNGFTTVVRKELSDNAGFLVVLAVDGGNMDLLPEASATPPVPVDLRAQTVSAFTEILGLVGIKSLTRQKKPYKGETTGCQFAPPSTGATSSDALTSKATAASSTPAVDDAANKLMKTQSSKAVAARAVPAKSTTTAGPDPTVEATVAPQQSVGTSVLQACLDAQGDLQPELACSLGLAVRDAAEGDSSLLPGDARRALEAAAAAVVLEKSTNYPGTTAPAFTDVLLLIQSAVTTPSAPVDPGNKTLTAAGVKEVQALAREIATVANPAGVSLDQLLGAFAKMAHQAVTFTTANQGLRFLTEADSAGYTIVTDIRHKDYGAAASKAFTAIDAALCPLDKKESTGACTDLNKDVRKFVRAAAVYAIDAETAGASATVSDDFRAAAVDLIEEIGGAGIRRKTFPGGKDRDGLQSAGLLFPDFTLRESLRPGFVAPSSPGSSPTAFMMYATVDWPDVRGKLWPPARAGNPLWLGINFSLLDAVGPLVELAARDPSLNADKSAGGAFALGFFVPRLELEFGMPQLTKNLVVGVGGAARLYRADRIEPTAAGGVPTASYCIIGQSGCKDGSFNWNNAEGTVFVKFVP